MHEDATEGFQSSGQASGPLQNVSIAPADVVQQVAVLKLAQQADGMITTAEDPADELYLYPFYAINGTKPLHICSADRQTSVHISMF